MAVTTQLAAMGCPSFEIGVRDAQAGKMMNREWSRDEVITNLGWLKHMNVKGNDVYCRPKAQWHHLVLVDDVDLETIALGCGVMGLRRRWWTAGRSPGGCVPRSPGPAWTSARSGASSTGKVCSASGRAKHVLGHRRHAAESYDR